MRCLGTRSFLDHLTLDREHSCRYSKKLNNVVEDCRVDVVVCRRDSQLEVSKRQDCCRSSVDNLALFFPTSPPANTDFRRLLFSCRASFKIQSCLASLPIVTNQLDIIGRSLVDGWLALRLVSEVGVSFRHSHGCKNTVYVGVLERSDDHADATFLIYVNTRLRTS